jgi:hypothetical protein
MIFEVLRSSVHFSKWEDTETSVSLSFDVVPKGSAYIEIGDKYILISNGYLRMQTKDRQPVDATISVSSNAAMIGNVKGKKPICGRADFFPERESDFDFTPAKLILTVLVEPHIFAEMLRLRLTAPGGTTLDADIEGLQFGWEPDGSHQIWKLDDLTDCELGTRRRITHFCWNTETFWTSEKSIMEEGDRQTNALLANSSNPEDRKLAASLQTSEKDDPIVQLLRHCRTILLLILVSAILAFVILKF